MISKCVSNIVASPRFKNIMRSALPKDATYWKVYAPILKVLSVSVEVEAIHEKLIKHLDLKDTDKLLDIGCGWGDWVIKTSDKVKTAVGIDLVKECVDGAREKIAERENVTFKQVDLNNGIPFEDKQFTIITGILVDSYFKDPSKVLDERIRALAPQGKLAFVLPIKGAKFYKVLLAEIKDRINRGKFLESVKYLPSAMVSALIFGTMAQIKDKIGEWNFTDADEILALLKEKGMEIKYISKVYADQALLIIAEKPQV